MMSGVISRRGKKKTETLARVSRNVAAAEVVVGTHTTWNGLRSMEQDKERDEEDREEISQSE
jgi:hypothetical protein